jgi:hypothetical protein
MALLAQSTAATHCAYLTATGQTATLTISKAGGAFGAAAGVVTELSGGYYCVALTTVDTNTLGELNFKWAGGTVTDPHEAASQVVDLFTLYSVVETGATLKQSTQLIAAATAGKVTVSGNTVTIQNAVAANVNRMVVTTDQFGQRSAFTYTI